MADARALAEPVLSDETLKEMATSLVTEYENNAASAECLLQIDRVKTGYFDKAQTEKAIQHFFESSQELDRKYTLYEESQGHSGRHYLPG